jgi:hypothetical protein
MYANQGEDDRRGPRRQPQETSGTFVVFIYPFSVKSRLHLVCAIRTSLHGIIIFSSHDKATQYKIDGN